MVATAFYSGLGIGAGRELVVVWPSSLGLMSIQPSTPFIGSAIIWSVCAVLNVIFYSLIAAMLYGLHRLFIGGLWHDFRAAVCSNALLDAASPPTS